MAKMNYINNKDNNQKKFDMENELKVVGNI